MTSKRNFLEKAGLLTVSAINNAQKDSSRISGSICDVYFAYKV